MDHLRIWYPTSTILDDLRHDVQKKFILARDDQVSLRTIRGLGTEKLERIGLLAGIQRDEKKDSRETTMFEIETIRLHNILLGG